MIKQKLYVEKYNSNKTNAYVSRITNILAVGYFGEAEFWLSLGKLTLIIMLYLFTLVTMCGGNPQGHAYGFSNWSKPVCDTEDFTILGDIYLPFHFR